MMLRAFEKSSISSSFAFVPPSFLVSRSHDRNPALYLLKADSLSATPGLWKNEKKQQRERCSSFGKLYCSSLQNPLIASPLKPLEMGESSQSESKSLKLLFVEMGVGYDQHGQDVTSAAVKACKNAITSNSIPAFRTGALPGVSWQQMKLKVKLGVPHSAQAALDIDKVKAVFPYGEIIDVEVVDGGLICSSGVALEALGDKSDDCYVVNAAVYVGY